MGQLDTKEIKKVLSANVTGISVGIPKDSKGKGAYLNTLGLKYHKLKKQYVA